MCFSPQRRLSFSGVCFLCEKMICGQHFTTLPGVALAEETLAFVNITFKHTEIEKSDQNIKQSTYFRTNLFTYTK